MSIYYFSNYQQFQRLVHGIATAKLGNMSVTYGPEKEVNQNRQRFFTLLGVSPENVVIAALEHSDQILDISEADQGKTATDPQGNLVGDALVTNKPEVFLFMVVADCLALLFFDPVKRVCGLAHCGWKGVDKELPRKVVQHFQSRYDSRPRDLLVAGSPAIKVGSACFPEVEQSQLPNWQPYIKSKPDQSCVDTSGYAFDQLIAAGIPETNIEFSPIDTRVDPRFFSHRRSVEDHLPEARFGVLIGLKSPK